MRIDVLTWRGLLVAGISLASAGCGRDAAAGLATVSGKVCYRGRPLATGTIVFAPDPTRGTRGELARGDIQPDGTYRLQSGEQLGIVPGWHRVTVMAVEDAPGTASPRSLLPVKYRDPELSGLACEVTSGRENTINFNLK